MPASDLSRKIAEAVRYELRRCEGYVNQEQMASLIDRAGVGDIVQQAQSWENRFAIQSERCDALAREIGYQMQQDGRIIAGLQSDNTVLAQRIEAADRFVVSHAKLGYENKRLLLRILRGEEL